ncbi:MAG: flagellar biosynthesis protein FlhA [Gallionellales bacterium 35-53-114]|jgi:flagellar biosynthesis protein FlhA|nr:MAG: flagellar biosynthesis protein FlhA [Gallionellales bacterium 35-53-114]OYZ64239.1 MAG: flagellar biosynthesis protein FlhA [Gallionellales bacterium 24-53-125]OZB10452.1 MAG: flagellar biosynthesis protein FlhA [Gallionellales bacterium 39-52-133]HQS57067.1 flagellar biosynthesis protein FlhA [Gallionellaceae bacterium]HQS74745.1 flagellar biosynthesis protein FlhA [Gallionellaceae bacterium]
MLLILQNFIKSAGLRNLAGPVLIVMVLAMMVLPLPPFLLDILFTFNIAMAIMVLLVSMNTTHPLDFAVFPTVLLITTLLRLSLNVASTRVVLLEGHTGGDAAGKVIEAFGHFLVGGNYAVGMVVFLILVVINFMVITKGAGRIAEVGARFTLDAMPGKQMAIDADLNAGLIGEDAARTRRAAVAQEAEFYGAMDGASKFVRGDAVAGIIILAITLVGGLVVGVLQHNMDIANAAKNYTLLAIGDGLVAQIPALIISTAAGLIVSRVASEQNIGQQLVRQLFNQPSVLILAAVIIAMMGLIPGMPHFAFLFLAAAMGGLAYYLINKPAVEEEVVAPVDISAMPVVESTEASWEDVSQVDVLGLEVGYRMITLVDKTQDGDLLRRIKGIRKKFTQDVGFLPPPVHIRDNLELRPNAYRITLKGAEIGSGEAFPNLFLAINPGNVTGELPGTVTRDPAFGLPAIWIEASMRDQAQNLGYTVVDAGTVVATHISHLIQTHSAELLGRHELQQLLDHLAKTAPKLTEDLVPKLLSLAAVQKILQNLLEEGMHIRDMRTILETLTEHAAQSQDTQQLTAQVRMALGPAIVQQLYPAAQELQVIGIDKELEFVLSQALQAGGGKAIEPGLANTLLREAQNAVHTQEQLGFPTVLLVPGQLRDLMARFLKRTLPQLKVLSHDEVPGFKSVRVTAVVGGRA